MLKTAIKHLLQAEMLYYFQKLGISPKDIERWHSTEEQFGVVSAYKDYIFLNGITHEVSLNENKQRTTQLIQEIQALGLRYESAKGIYKEEDKPPELEKAIKVHDITFDYLLYLGELFDQTVILFKSSGGSLGWYDIPTMNAYEMIDYEVRTNVPKPPRPEDIPIEEELEPRTRFRQTELYYNFDWDNPVPFTNRPVF